jgi:hypothetical protein
MGDSEQTEHPETELASRAGGVVAEGAVMGCAGLTQAGRKPTGARCSCATSATPPAPRRSARSSRHAFHKASPSSPSQRHFFPPRAVVTHLSLTQDYGKILDVYLPNGPLPPST